MGINRANIGIDRTVVFGAVLEDDTANTDGRVEF